MSPAEPVPARGWTGASLAELSQPFGDQCPADAAALPVGPDGHWAKTQPAARLPVDGDG